MTSVSYPHVDAQPGFCLWCGEKTRFLKNGNAVKYCSDYCGTSASSFRTTGRIAPLPGDRKVWNGCCEGCGSQISKSGKNPKKWCSERCRLRRYRSDNPDKVAAARERARVLQREKTLSKGPVPACANCGGDLRNRRSGWKYCSRSECRAARKYENSLKGPMCSATSCIRPVQAKGLCSSHYATYWRRNNPEGATAIRHRRRSVQREAFVENVDISVVLERSGWKCGICGEGIPKDAVFPDSLYRSLDHIVPLSKGGKHEYGNVQAAHYGCNAAKSDRLEL